MRLRASAIFLALFSAAAAPVAAEQVALQETFEFSVTGVFPPTGWTEVDISAAGRPGWEDNGSFCSSLGGVNIAGHDDWDGVTLQETRLVTPTLDFSTYVAPHMNFHSGGCNTGALQSSATGGSDRHDVEVSIDGGLTWTVVWTANTGGATSYAQIPVTLDLSSYAGMVQVQIGFLYSGEASQWAIDNVTVIDAPTGGSLNVVGTCGQPGSYLFVQNVTPLSTVVFAFSFLQGGRIYSSNQCPAVLTGLARWPPMVVGLETATGFGTAEAIPLQGIPPNACGFFIQAFDLVTCLPTNVVQL